MYTKNPEYFLTVAREGSISRAAEKLYLSQPYLSQCIGRGGAGAFPYLENACVSAGWSRSFR